MLDLEVSSLFIKIAYLLSELREHLKASGGGCYPGQGQL